MTTATDVIAALNQRRQRKSLRPEASGQFPSGWQDWFDAMPRVDAHAPGAAVASLVDAAAAKPLRAIPRSPRRLNRWQAFGVLWQQNWEPDLREDRGLRIGVRVQRVSVAEALAIASRYAGPMPDSGQTRNAVPICTACAPSASAAAMPRPSMMPPAAITGMPKRSTHCGTSDRVPIMLA